MHRDTFEQEKAKYPHLNREEMYSLNSEEESVHYLNTKGRASMPACD